MHLVKAYDRKQRLEQTAAAVIVWSFAKCAQSRFNSEHPKLQ